MKGTVTISLEDYENLIKRHEDEQRASQYLSGKMVDFLRRLSAENPHLEDRIMDFAKSVDK